MPDIGYEFWKSDAIPGISVLMVELNHCPLHMHREIELCYIFEGSAEVLCRNERYLLRSGDHFLFQKRYAHELYSAEPEKSVKLMRLKISDSFCQMIYPEFSNIAFLETCPGTNCSEENKRRIETLFLNLAKQYYDHKPLFQFDCVAYTMRILKTLLTAYAWRIIPASEMQQLQVRQERINRFIRYVSEHFTEKITLEEIAGSENLSRSYMSHFVRDELSMSFQEYLAHLRCDKARHMLSLSTEQTMTDIALASGFQDTRQMKTAFTKNYGLTPVEYRHRWKLSGSSSPIPFYQKLGYDNDQEYIGESDARSYILSYVPKDKK